MDDSHKNPFLPKKKVSRGKTKTQHQDGDGGRKTGPVWDFSETAPRSDGAERPRGRRTITSLWRSPGVVQKTLHLTHGR